MSAPEAGGLDATLNGEDEDDFFDLQIVKHYDEEVSTPNLMDSFQNDMGSSKMCKNTLHFSLHHNQPVVAHITFNTCNN